MSQISNDPPSTRASCKFHEQVEISKRTTIHTRGMILLPPYANKKNSAVCSYYCHRGEAICGPIYSREKEVSLVSSKCGVNLDSFPLHLGKLEDASFYIGLADASYATLNIRRQHRKCKLLGMQRLTKRESLKDPRIFHRSTITVTVQE